MVRCVKQDGRISLPFFLSSRVPRGAVKGRVEKEKERRCGQTPKDRSNGAPRLDRKENFLAHLWQMARPLAVASKSDFDKVKKSRKKARF